MSTINKINHDVLVSLNESTTDPKDYAQSLAYYVDRKSAIVRSLRDRLTTILKGGILHSGDGSIDENILPREMWYTPIKTTIVEINGVEYAEGDTINLHAKALAEILDKVLDQDDPSFVRYTPSASDYIDSVEQFCKAYCPAWDQFNAGLLTEAAIISPYVVDIVNDSTNEIVMTINNDTAVDLAQVLVYKDSHTVHRRKDTLPTVAIDVVQTLQDLTDTVDSNVTLVTCLSNLASNINLSVSEILASLSSSVGSRAQQAMSSNSEIIQLATDQSMSVESRISNIISVLATDLSTIEQNGMSYDEGVDGLSFNPDLYSSSSATAFWEASKASETISSALQISASVLNNTAKAVCGIFKLAGRGISRLWKKYVTPAFVSKDFVKTEYDTRESFCDVPCMIVGNSNDAVKFDTNKIATHVASSLTENTMFEGRLDFNSILEATELTVSRGIVQLRAPTTTGFNVASSSCRLSTVNDTHRRHMTIHTRKKTMIMNDEGVVEEYANLTGNAYKRIPGSYQWVLKIGDKYSPVFSQNPVSLTKPVYYKGDAKVIVANNNGTVDGAGPVVAKRIQLWFLKQYSTNLVSDTSNYVQVLMRVDDTVDVLNMLVEGNPDTFRIDTSSNGWIMNEGLGNVYYEINAASINSDFSTFNFVTDKVQIRLVITHDSRMSGYNFGNIFVKDVNSPNFATGKVDINTSDSVSTFSYTLDTVAPGICMDKYIMEVPDSDWYLTSTGDLQHSTGQTVYVVHSSTGPKLRDTTGEIIPLGVNMDSSHFSGDCQITVKAYDFSATITYTHNTHQDLYVAFKFTATLADTVLTHSLVTENSPNSFYDIPGVAENDRKKTEWVNESTYRYYSAPISILSTETISAMIKDASVPFDPGCACVLRKTFGAIEVFNYPGSDNVSPGMRLLAYLTPIVPDKLLLPSGKMRIRYENEQCRIYSDENTYEVVTPNQLVDHFLSVAETLSSHSSEFDFEEGDVQAFKSLYAAKVVMDVYLNVVKTPSQDAYLNFFTKDGYYTFKVMHCFDISQEYISSQIDRQQLVDLILHPTDRMTESSSDVDVILNMLGYQIISNKPSFMQAYYYIHGTFPQFIPYIIGDRLDMAKWHVNTDDEVQSYVEKFISSLIITALVITAVALTGVAVLKTRKYLKGKINTSQTAEFNRQQTISTQLNEIEDTKAKIANWESQLANTSDPNIVEDLQRSIANGKLGLGVQERNLKDLRKGLLNTKKKTALWSKVATGLGVTVTPAAAMSQYSHEVGLFDVAQEETFVQTDNSDVITGLSNLRNSMDSQFASTVDKMSESLEANGDDIVYSLEEMTEEVKQHMVSTAFVSVIANAVTQSVVASIKSKIPDLNFGI